MTIKQLPHNKPLYEQVFQLIENQIINGELLIGDKLPTEKELTERYKVSRTVIREAIKALKEKGWVETYVAKGTFIIYNMEKSVQSSFDAAVRMKPEDRFSNLIQVRLILEPEIAALAAVSASQENIAKMRQALNQMKKALKDNNNVDSFLEGDFAFHMAIAESTGNNLIRIIMAPVVNLLRNIQQYHLSHVESGNQRSQGFHNKVMEAIERHDPKAARSSMYEHIIQVRDDIKDTIESKTLSNH